MKPTFYFAPMNHLGNYLFRHLLLKNGADYVFAELCRVDRLDMEAKKSKFKTISTDISKTIYQIAAGTIEEIETGVFRLKKEIPDIKEINLNMGCPQSTMIKINIGAGILYDVGVMQSLLSKLFAVCSQQNIIPSVKIRIGLRPDNIMIEKYLEIIKNAQIKKVYIHARTIAHPYYKPCNIEAMEHITTKFPDLTIIYNGDIDSFEAFNKITEHKNLNFEHYMIGRAVLNNPLLFKQIKEKKLVDKYSETFDPLLNDFYVVKKEGGRHLSSEKYNFILELITLAKEYDEFEIIKKNLAFLTKGLSNNNEFMRQLYGSKTVDEIELHFKEILN